MTDESGGGASRTTLPAAGTSAATDVSLREHLAQMLASSERRFEQLFHELRLADQRFDEERDRRYMEVALEREKATRIKEAADLAALSLAREIQAYKDEKANELRAQIESERGSYATRAELKASDQRLEAMMKPALDWMLSQQGRSQGVGVSANALVVVVTIILAALGLYLGTGR